jgi:YD repeat-containing protein
VVEMGMVPDDPGGNWAIALTRDGAGLVTAIRFTKDSITYQATVTRDINDRVTGITAYAVV